MNCFPQEQSVDIEAKIYGFIEAVDSMPLEAIEQACSNFKEGKAKGQSLDFAPASARFSVEVERCLSVIKARKRLENKQITAPQQSENVVYLMDTPQGQKKMEELQQALSTNDPNAIDSLIKKYGYDK